MNQRRYLTLDAMRGLAALFVVARHFSDARGPSQPFYSYLAVDLFFLLSGFVLDLSYRLRFSIGLSFFQFMRLRAIRLWPMYLVGALVGSIGLILELRAGHLSVGELITAFFASLLILPSPTWNFSPILFPTISPAWSLFFELYVANSIFALFKGCGKTSVLTIFVMVSLCCLLFAQSHYGGLNIGSNWSSALGGVPRVMFSFFAGVLLHRMHAVSSVSIRVPSFIVLIALIIILAMPEEVFNPRLYEIACVVFLFPVLIFLGAQAVERRPIIGSTLGDISYGMYVLHYPLLKGCERIMAATHIYPGYALEVIFVISVALLSIILHTYFDVPFRRWLSVQGQASSKATSN